MSEGGGDDGASRRGEGRPLGVLLTFLQLGTIAFGGPVAHLGYFRDALVRQRKWIDERGYADLVALCQLLPGPASSQVAIALGAHRAGWLGGLAAWVGFTLPSALLMLGLAIMLRGRSEMLPEPVLRGLELVALVVVAQAVWEMGVRLCPDRLRAALAFVVAAAVLVFVGPWTPPLALLIAGVLGMLLIPDQETEGASEPAERGRSGATVALVVFLLLLVGLPILAEALDRPALDIFDRFYRTGSLVFGGGHVVLPLLQSEVVAPGWVDQDLFLAGYGAAQALPGPLFSYAAYLGALIEPGPGGVPGGVIALVGIYLPSFLLLAGVLPLWRGLRRHPSARRALAGVNAAVVGLLIAALYQPIWRQAIDAPVHVALALLLFALLRFARWPPWLLVALAAAGGALVAGGG